MRTTVEISDAQHRSLTDLAARRGLRGFSPLVQEAIEQYLDACGGPDLEAALSLRGSISDDEAASLRERIEEAWTAWRSTP
jgi:hypothetical protein